MTKQTLKKIDTAMILMAITFALAAAAVTPEAREAITMKSILFFAMFAFARHLCHFKFIENHAAALK